MSTSTNTPISEIQQMMNSISSNNSSLPSSSSSVSSTPSSPSNTPNTGSGSVSATPDLSSVSSYNESPFTNPLYLSALMVGLILIITVIVYLGGTGGQNSSVSTTTTSGYSVGLDSSSNQSGNKKSSVLTILLIIVVTLLILYVTQYVLYYYFNIDISTNLSNMLNTNKQPELDVNINKETQPTPAPAPAPAPVVQPSSGNQVFNIRDNAYTYEDAQMICQAFDAKLATYQQVEDAYNNGGEWCNYGWSADQLALFPTQQSTYNKLQQTTDHKHDCGRPGVNGGYIANPNVRFGVNCYGKKPTMTNADEELMEQVTPYPQTPQEQQMEETVNMWKENIDDILVSPFNYTKWSE